MARRRQAQPAPPPPPAHEDRVLVVHFTAGPPEEFAPGAVAEVRKQLLVIGRGEAVEAEYRRSLVRGWRYKDPAPGGTA